VGGSGAGVAVEYIFDSSLLDRSASVRGAHDRERRSEGLLGNAARVVEGVTGPAVCTNSSPASLPDVR